jgi:hypothetical protein
MSRSPRERPQMHVSISSWMPSVFGKTPLVGGVLGTKVAVGMEIVYVNQPSIGIQRHHICHFVPYNLSDSIY